MKREIRSRYRRKISHKNCVQNARNMKNCQFVGKNVFEILNAKMDLIIKISYRWNFKFVDQNGNKNDNNNKHLCMRVYAKFLKSFLE